MEDSSKGAPGSLELVRAFVNTADLDADADELSSVRALVGWLSRKGMASDTMRATREDLKRALELREAIRAGLLAHTEGAATPPAACSVIDSVGERALLAPRLDSQGRSLLEPRAHGIDAALGRLLAIIHEAVAAGTWPRLKACHEESCRWAFYDHTKNRSGSWCSMAVCGNRAKARAYRQRRTRA
jgi:predicted RNA-binding Zn ribbon-like protein